MEDIRHFLQSNSLNSIIFKLADIERYEDEHPGMVNKDYSPLDGKERRELGQLRAMKNKMDLTIKAAVHIGVFCEKKKKKGTGNQRN